jgi:hypothetical protein
MIDSIKMDVMLDKGFDVKDAPLRTQLAQVLATILQYYHLPV